MPRKIRQLKADLRKAGFSWRPGKGSHTVWEHLLLPGDKVTLSGNDGDDAQSYQERDVRTILANLREAQKRQL
jgi:predicted RNA binding protein YcfA (HicA-like mRNA interferase family)